MITQLRLKADVDREDKIRLSGVFDPAEIQLLGLLRDGPDTTTPRGARRDGGCGIFVQLSFGSVLSIGSAGSILSIGSVGSILSIGGAGLRPGPEEEPEEGER